MQINVRVNGVLAQKMPLTRFPVTLHQRATVADLVEQLQREYPHLAEEIYRAVTVSGGEHQAPSAVLREGQEIAVLLPIAGG